MQTEARLAATRGPAASRAATPRALGAASTMGTADPSSASLAASPGAIRKMTEVWRALRSTGELYSNRAHAETARESALKRKARLDIDLYASFEATPLESCVAHPAEEIIDDALRTIPGGLAYDFLEEYCLNDENPVYGASVLRCLARLTKPGTAEWRAQIVRGALASANLEVRDNAMQAAESWGDPGMVDILQAHEEPEPYLREYLQDVVAELSPGS